MHNVKQWSLSAAYHKECQVHVADAEATAKSNAPSSILLRLQLLALLREAGVSELLAMNSLGCQVGSCKGAIATYVCFLAHAADLLALLARREPVVSELLAMNGLGRLVGQLQSGDAAVTQSLLRVVCCMANGGAALQEMYQVGWGAAILLTFIGLSFPLVGGGGCLPPKQPVFLSLLQEVFSPCVCL